ncbi:MAG: hypothetical protein ACHQ4G_02880 [Opitutales bacterium]
MADFKRETLRGSPGFFRVAQTQAGPWWLLDGADRPFFAKAVHGVAAEASVVHDPVARLRSWGFNTLGCGSGQPQREEGLAFLATADFCAAGPPLQLAGVRLPDVFDAAWPRLAAERAAQVCLPLAENRELLGWLTDDAPGWAPFPGVRQPGLLQVCLSLEPGLAAYHAAWEFALALHGGRWDGLTRAWGVGLANKEALRALTRREEGLATRGYLRDDERWVREFARRYFTTAVAAIRAQAPHQLVFGCRWGGPVSAALRGECAAVADVGLVDHADLVDGTPGPVMLGDFNWAGERFFGGPTPRGLLGPTRLERMLRRGRAALAAGVAHPAVVGYAWSRWHDRRGDEPPFGSGLVRGDESEAREHTELLTAINDRVEVLRAMAQLTEEII